VSVIVDDKHMIVKSLAALLTAPERNASAVTENAKSLLYCVRDFRELVNGAKQLH
jgi:hypothetical protein